MQSGCLDNGIGTDARHEVIPSGFDLQRFRSAELPEDWETLLDVEKGARKPFVVLMMAALEPRKRHLQLLEQLPPLIAAYPETRIVFAGEGPLRDEIRAKADVLGIGSSVKLAGYRRDQSD
jgi:glycosyltransferase involved in cell wall biosynthesis